MKISSMIYMEFNTWQAQNPYNFTVMQTIALWHYWEGSKDLRFLFWGRKNQFNLSYPCRTKGIDGCERQVIPFCRKQFQAQPYSEHFTATSSTGHNALGLSSPASWYCEIKCFTLVFILLLVWRHMLKLLTQNDGACWILCHNLSCSCVNFPHFYGAKYLMNDSWNYFL